MTSDLAQTSDVSGPSAPSLLTRFRQFTLSKAALAFVDQCAVSGQAFLTLLLMGTLADLAQVGAFAIALSVIVIALAVQDAAITRPYTIQLHAPIGSARGHLLASFRLSLALAGVISLAVLVFSIFLVVKGRPSDGQIAIALALALPGAMLREFGRRVSFAHERSLEALMIDAPAVCIGLVGIVMLGLTGHLSAATGLLVLAATNFTAGACWIMAKGLVCANEKVETTPVAVASWAMGRWLIVNQIAIQVQGYTTQWFALIFLGVHATGVLAASLSIIAFANPILFGLFNIMIPKSARVFRQSGNQGVLKRALRDSAVLVGLMFVFCIVITVFGQQIMSALYPKTGDTWHLLIVLAVSAMLASAGAPAAIALASANKAANLALVAGFAALFNLAIVVVLMPIGGLLGAAYGTLLAELVGTAGRWIALYRAVGFRSGDFSKNEPEVLRHAG